MGAIKTLRDKWAYKKAKWRYRNRKVTRAKMLYWYFIFSGITMFLYAISCLFTGLPYIYVLAPLAALIGYFVLISLVKNWKLIWLYIRDVDQGKLLLYLNKNTNFSTPHKLKLVHWVYLRKNTVRNERWLELGDKVRNGNELTLEEKVEYRSRVVYCPQQVRDGVNEAILINALIFAHIQIHVLDDNIRNILNLTNDNMNSFDLQREINRCKVTEEKEKADEYAKKGMEILKKKK